MGNHRIIIGNVVACGARHVPAAVLVNRTELDCSPELQHGGLHLLVETRTGTERRAAGAPKVTMVTVGQPYNKVKFTPFNLFIYYGIPHSVRNPIRSRRLTPYVLHGNKLY